MRRFTLTFRIEAPDTPNIARRLASAFELIVNRKALGKDAESVRINAPNCSEEDTPQPELLRKLTRKESARFHALLKINAEAESPDTQALLEIKKQFPRLRNAYGIKTDSHACYLIPAGHPMELKIERELKEFRPKNKTQEAQ